MKRTPLRARVKPKLTHEEKLVLYNKLVNRMLAKAGRQLEDVLWHVPKRRSRLKPIGAVKAREKPAIVAFRERLMERAGDSCERCGCKVGAGRLEPHHLVRRARCVGWQDRHSPELNGLGVCSPCHRSLTLDPVDIGGPAEGASRRAHAAFEVWRAERSIFFR
jgi:hypothetical protein